jgi:hypothetical protein
MSVVIPRRSREYEVNAGSNLTSSRNEWKQVKGDASELGSL